MISDPKSTTLNRIGRYDVICELGRGGMGVVYRAEDKSIGRDVAIKTLTEVTPELRERFYVEARSGILSHPNIATVYELGEHDGIPFIAMEFLAGESLDKILRKRGRLPVLEALWIVEQVCAGLGYAHQHGLVHRDVKPANIVVLPDGRSKIVDFGIARMTDQGPRLTKTDVLLGTFHYLAPERLKGEASDGRADIWSVGVMLYEMITGELPFKGKDVAALYRVMHESYVPLAELIKDVPEPLGAVLDKTLAKDLDKRYATTEEIALDLQPIKDGLKRERVETLLESARRLAGEHQFANARTVLLQAQQIDPANTNAKTLLKEVQDQLIQLQRGERVRQILALAEDAVASQQYDDAITYFTQAMQLDMEGEAELTARIEQVQALQERLQQVRSLSGQASEARRRGDLTMAQNLIEKALQLDEKNTNLRNAHSIILREIKRKQEGIKIEDLLKGAREEYSARRYTEAIARLREAAEIDPTHSEVQQLLMVATARQKEERKRLLLDQAVAEIHDCLEGADFDRAHDRVLRALEALPSEALLLGLKVEIERKKQAFESQQVVRSALLRAQEMLLEQPANSLPIIDAALEQVPRDESLLQFRSRLVEHLGAIQKEARRVQRFKVAHEAMEAKRFDLAIGELESMSAEGGGSDELESLLALARREQWQETERAKREALWQDIRELQQRSEWEKIVMRLEPEIVGDGDAPLAAALEDARRRVRDAAERIATLLLRARTLAQTNISPALQLLSIQPQEVSGNEEVVALRKELTQRAELARAIDAARAHSEELLAAGDLSGSMNEFARVAKIHGESEALALARQRSEQRRQSTADAALRSSILRAREALRISGKRAVEELHRTRRAANFASEPVRAEWEALREKTRGAPGQKAASSPAKETKKRSWVAVLAAVSALAVISVLIVGLGISRHRHNSIPITSTAAAPLPQAVVADTYLEVNASPWATVVRIQNSAGNSIDLHSPQPLTPFRLDGVPPGSYEVTLKGPGSGQEQVVHCVINAAQHLCSADLDTPDTQQLLKGAQP
jgi:predicted Ser/Thr protein kinase